jgi:hypothetical protein
LLQDDSGLLEAGVGHRGADGAHPGRGHPQVGVDERQHPRPVVERAGDDRGQVVPARQPPQPPAQVGQFTGTKQFVAAVSPG